MKKLFYILIIMFSGLSAISQVNKHLDVYWDNGIKAKSLDGNFKIKMGGRVQFDVMWIHQDDTLNQYFDAKNGAEIRRAMVYTSGTVYKNIKFKLQLDFAGGIVILKDAYIQLIKIPVVGNFRVGNFKEPMGLSMLTSSNFLTEMERSLANVFDNNRNLGFMMFNQHLEKRLSWFAGYFYPANNSGIYLGNKYNLAARLVGLPVYNTNNGYKILHIGAAYVYQYHDNTPISFKLRPEAFLAPIYLSVDVDNVASVSDFNGEFLLIFNTLSFESEYTVSTVNMSSSASYNKSSYNFYAYYATFSWFLTGEHKNYIKSKTIFGRLTPKNNMGQNGGFGAIELSLRYSNVNLNDNDLQGGNMSNITGGINWYLSPATKIALNYVYANVNNIGKANIFQMRFQVIF